MREAETEVRAWVEDQRGGFDAGSGAMFDHRLDRFGIAWHELDSGDHDTYLAEVDRRKVDAARRVTDAEQVVRQAEAQRVLAWQDYVDARVRLGGTSPGHPSGPSASADDGSDPADQLIRTGADPVSSRTVVAGGPNYREPELLSGKARFEPLMWAFVLGAIIGDIAAFYSVLAKLFRTEPVLVAAVAVGFAAGAIGICHLVGVGLRRRRSGDRRRNDVLLGLKILGWFALGCAAFAVRLRYDAGSSGVAGGANFGSAASVDDSDRDLLAAFVFAGLYAVSGLLAMTASFYAFNPAARAYRRALRHLTKVERALGSGKAQHAEQLEYQKAVNEELARAPQRRAAVYRRTEADVVSLKILVRHRMAAELGDPEALDLLMRGAPKVDKYPAPEGV